jgi:hypothetical protein
LSFSPSTLHLAKVEGPFLAVLRHSQMSASVTTG